MTFDVSIYRKYVKDPSIDTRMCLSDALDEIERQAKRISVLDAAHRLFIESNKKIKIFEKRQTDGILAALGMYEELEKTNHKQRAALKKLGQAKRERGKALVEERARFEYYVQNENCESWPEARRKYPELEKKYIGIAREQLRLEGKL